MIDLKIAHHFSSGVYAKQMHLPADHYAESHAHEYDHLSILACGTALITVNGEETRYRAPACIEIKAGVSHKITALSPVDWFCIHATNETNADAIDEILIKKGA